MPGEQQITEVVRDAVADLDTDLEGRTIGQYRLLRRIGSGGMGSVFQAERIDGTYEQTVAVKIVKKGMDTENVIQRFRVEQQILARLDHPNIARIIDGGVTEQGRPYFVMEYVPGVPITTYCDANRLGIRRRLELFRTACDAVHHAHKSLVVHRDLKPSNILVTEQGEIKLLDFGIAKLLDENEDPQLTRTGFQVLTPGYASPEQLLGQQITTTTDVYALGIILYELMTGRRPFEVRRTAEEMRDQVLSGEPKRPSTSLTRVPLSEDGRERAEVTRQISEARSIEIDRLRKRLRGDLDNICLMALRREPERRYGSAEQLATDIGRHLEGLPVIAMPDSVNYRVGKFVRRHQLGVVGVTATLVAFIALVGFYTARLAAERDFALEEQRKTNEVVSFVTGLFQTSDPGESRGEQITARELLDAGAQRVRNELADRPAIQANMMRVLGEVYFQLGSYSRAIELIGQALERQRLLASGADLEVATSELVLGMVQQTVGDLEKAEPLINSALEQRTELLGYAHADVLEALSAKAFLQETMGNYTEAERLHEEAHALGRQLFSTDNTYLAEAITKLAAIYRIQDKNDLAEPMLRDALAMQLRLYGGDHPKTAETQRQLAGLLRNTRRYTEARTMYLELIENRTRMLGPNHTEVAHTWGSYSQLLADMGETREAIEANDKLIDITQRIHDGPHPSLAAAYNNRAVLERDLGNLDGAIDYYQRSIDMQDAINLPSRHPNRSFPLAGMANVMVRQGRSAEAEPLARQALDLRLETFSPDHVLVWEVRSLIGWALVGTGDVQESERLLLDAYNWFLDNLGPDDGRTRLSAGYLAQLYERTGDTDKQSTFEDRAQ